MGVAHQAPHDGRLAHPLNRNGPLGLGPRVVVERWASRSLGGYLITDPPQKSDPMWIHSLKHGTDYTWAHYPNT